MNFDLSTLKPGDEVGIQVGRNLGVSRVVAVHEDGVIEIEDEDFYGPDGRNLAVAVVSSITCRLVEPTDEGRMGSLRESIRTDLDILGDRANRMSLEALREFREVTLGLLAKVEPKENS